MIVSDDSPVDGMAAQGWQEKPARFIAAALHAWRGITPSQYAWTTGIALVFVLGYLVGLLPEVLGTTSNLIGPTPPRWGIARFVGVTFNGFVVAYCFLLAVSIAEQGVRHRRDRVWRYAIAGILAGGATLALETLLTLLAPSTAGWGDSPDPRKVLGMVVWNAADLLLWGGLALAVYARIQAARLARKAFSDAELERMEANREVLSARLATMQAQVEPQFLLGTLARVEALYDSEPGSGARMLDGLIAYLRAALPQLRSEWSTLQREAQLAESYLRIVELRMGSRLEYAFDIQPGLDDCEFPPMMLLPLIDDALRNGLEPLPHGGKVTLTARQDRDRLRVSVIDDGLPRPADLNGNSAIATLHDRLRGFYDDTARLELTANAPQGVIALIEVPLETPRDHR